MYKNIDKILKEDEEILINTEPKKKIFHKADWFLVPLSIVFVMPISVLTFILMLNPSADLAWRILVFPFFFAFFYMFLGRFAAKLITKLRTYYYVTNRRVIIVKHVFKPKVNSCYLSSIKKIDKDVRKNGLGNVSFYLSSESKSRFANYGFDFMVPKEGRRGLAPLTFFDIKDAEEVYKKTYEIRSNA